MLTIRQSTVLLRIPAGLAIRHSVTERNRESRNAIAAHDGSSSQETVKRFGAQLLPADSQLLVRGVGNAPLDARARTLVQALGRVSHSARDLTLDFVNIRRYPGFFLSTLVIYPTSFTRVGHPLTPFDESSLEGSRRLSLF